MPGVMVATEELFARAVQRARLGEHEQARALCEEVLSHQAEHAAARDLLSLLRGEAGNTIEQGRLCLALGRPEQALTLLQAAVDSQPEQAEARALLGTAQRLRGQAVEAARHYESALILDPQQPHALVGQAVLLWQRGNTRTALDRLRRLVEETPTNVDAQMTLGDLLYDMGDYIGAARHLGRLLDRYPQLLPSRQVLARCLSRKPVAVLALENERHVEDSYAYPDVEVEHLAQASVVLLLRRPSLQPLWNLGSVPEACRALRAGELDHVVSDTFLPLVISSGVLSDLTIERGLTALRGAVLERLEQESEERLLALAEALALAGWHNEFVFAVTAEEQEILRRLRSRQDRTAALAQAMYAPLARPVDGLERLVALHITEPEEERALAREIVSLTPLSGDVSNAVNRQYEENPYPRWRGMTRTTRRRTAWKPSSPTGRRRPCWNARAFWWRGVARAATC
jgi:Flp pilus assembly protein TadD